MFRPRILAALLIAAGPFLLPSPLTRSALAAPARDAQAEAFIAGLASTAAATLRENLPPEALDRRFRQIFEENFDIARMSRFVLGRYANAVDERDRQEFQELFESYVVRLYVRNFREFSGQDLRVTGSRAGNNFAQIQTRIIVSGRAPLDVDWTVTKYSDGRFRIIDISVDGVSPLIAEREENLSLIANHGLAWVNRELRKRLSP